MKIVKFLLLGLGFWLLYFTIQKVGFGNIEGYLRQMGWSALPILIIYPLIFFFDTLGWLYAFPKSLPKHIPFLDLYFIRIIGETMNCIIPWAASLGGEPLKVQLLKSRHGISLAEGYASILIVHTTFWISLNCFVIGAIVFTLKSLPLTPILWHSVLIFLVVLGVVAALLVAGLHWGIFERFHSIGEAFKWWGEHSHEKKQKFISLDRDIKTFYTENKSRFFLSSFFNLLGWLMGMFEVYFIGRALGLPIGITEAWLLEALIQVLRIVTFFIPSSIGTQEGGIVLIFSQFGFAGPASLAFAIVRRIREMIWIGFGLVLWSLLSDRSKTTS